MDKEIDLRLSSSLLASSSLSVALLSSGELLSEQMFFPRKRILIEHQL